MSTLDTTHQGLLKDVKVLIVDDEHYTRKVIHTLLLADRLHQDLRSRRRRDRPGDDPRGRARHRAARLGDAGHRRRGIRPPGALARHRFRCPDVPIIMLTGHGERSRVLEAVRLGVHEFLLKPVSSDALQARILSVLTEAAQDGQARRLLRAGAAQAGEPTSRRPRATDPTRRIARRSTQAAVDPAASSRDSFVELIAAAGTCRARH